VEAVKRDPIIRTSSLSMYGYIVLFDDEERPTRRQKNEESEKREYVYTHTLRINMHSM
jgi:hypothetical protein